MSNFRTVDNPVPEPEKPKGPVFADVAAILANGLEPERPSIAEVIPGTYLFYSGRINEAHSEPGLGKTNVATALSGQVMSTGQAVLYIDPEDCAEGILRRFKSFGISDATLIQNLKYFHNPAPADFAGLIEWAKENKPAFVVIDGLAEALTSEGLNEDVAGDVLSFFRLRVRPFADAGAAVLISDHVAKAAEGRGRWARGSGAKLGRYDGAVYSVELVQAYSPTVAGSVRLVLAKDRCGGIGPVGTVAIEIGFNPTDEGTDITFRKPEVRGEFMPTGLMEKISRRLEINPDATKRELRDLGKSEYVDLGIKKLIELEYLKMTKGGPGRATKYNLLKPFTEDQLNRVPSVSLPCPGHTP